MQFLIGLTKLSGHICNTLVVNYHWSCLNNILIHVASTSRHLVVPFIVAQTQPAKLVPALATGHVHASLVLLNWSHAVGTSLCVTLHPMEALCGLKLSFNLFHMLICFSHATDNFIDPLGEALAVDWHMCLSQTRIAKGRLAAVALDVHSLKHVERLDSSGTVSPWAPLEPLGEVDEASGQEAAVSLVQFDAE